MWFKFDYRENKKNINVIIWRIPKQYLARYLGQYLPTGRLLNLPLDRPILSVSLLKTRSRNQTTHSVLMFLYISESTINLSYSKPIHGR